MTYTQDGRAWIEFCARLFSQNQFAIKLGLQPMQQALEQLGQPHLQHQRVLIAGTNGKGSTASALSALLTSAGLRVGLYTSPHLVDFTERFRINGKPIAQSDVLTCGLDILARFASPDKQPCLTFFELTTIMAVELFSRQNVDIAIYEVGLGGRLDATNALDPQLSIITTLGFDHQKYLGDTIESIAYEKSGIMRQTRPVILGPQEHPGALDALREQAHLHKVSFCEVFGEHFDIDGNLPEAPTTQMRRHWAVAHRAASWCVRQFGKHAAPDVQALTRLSWFGRYERRQHQSITMLLDAAHNADGVRLLFEHLAREPSQPSFVLTGAMHDKDLHALYSPLHQLDANIIGVLIDNPRAADEATLRAHLPKDRLLAVAPLADAWSMITEQQTPTVVLVYGSLYLLGELYGLLNIDVGAVHE